MSYLPVSGYVGTPFRNIIDTSLQQHTVCAESQSCIVLINTLPTRRMHHDLISVTAQVGLSDV